MLQACAKKALKQCKKQRPQETTYVYPFFLLSKYEQLRMFINYLKALRACWAESWTDKPLHGGMLRSV